MKKISLFFLIILTINTVPVYAQTLSFSYETDEELYFSRIDPVMDIITVNGTLLVDGVPSTNRLITLYVEKPNGNPLFIKTVNTGSNPSEDPFIEIQSVRTIDGAGDDKTLYMAGDGPGHSVRVEAIIRNGALFNVPVRTTCSIWDADDKPIGFASFYDSDFNSYQISEYYFDINLPTYTSNGEAKVCIGVYTEFPDHIDPRYNDNGAAWAPEVSRTIIVQGGSDPILPLDQSTPSGTFKHSARLPPIVHQGVRLIDWGVYSLFLTSPARSVGETSAYESKSFDIQIAGDFDVEFNPKDGDIDFDDIVSFIGAFNDWGYYWIVDPAADFDENEIIDFEDIVLFIRQYNALASG
jgi:hypothetical protein